MRIFQLCGDAGVEPAALRGSAVHLRAIAGGLLKRGHQVITLASGSAAGPEKFPAPTRVLRSEADVLTAAEEAGTPDLIYERYTLGHQVSLVPGHRDLAGRCTPEAGLKAAQEIGCPFVLEVNSPMILESLRHRGLEPNPQHYAYEKLLFASADAVVAVSEPMRRYVAWIRGSDRRTVTVHNGFHPELFGSPASLEARPQVLAFCGNPRPWHGLDFIPPLLAQLAKRGLRPVVRVIGGPVMAADAIAGTELKRLKDSARRHGVESQLDLVGGVTQERAANLLSTATLGLAPYRPDPFFYFSPLKIFEYMGAGLPVVSNAQGELAEIVGDGGRVVPPGDPDAFFDAVEELLRDPSLSRDLGARARQRAFDNYTWAHAVKKLETQFLELLGTRVT